MRLDTIRQTIQEVEVTYLGETLRVGYFPAAMTPDTADTLAAEAAKGEQASSRDLMAGMLAPVLAWWDLYATEQDERDGRRMETTAEVIGSLPIDLLGKVQEAIQGDMKPPGSKG